MTATRTALKTLLLVALLVIVSYSQTCDIANDLRTDCGQSTTTQQQCESKGCCWRPVQLLNSDTKQNTQGNTPSCFYPLGQCANVKFSWNKGMGFNSSFYNKMYGFFMANLNIQGKGGVVAAPDYSTPGGSYYFNWMRDAAYSMRTFMELHNFNLSVIRFHMDAYVGWVKHVQNQPNPAGFPDIRINPKFELPDGQVFSGPWCRPQTDGPALRSATLQLYAKTLLENGEVNYVKTILVSIIQDDLNWILSNWRLMGCDLWEEVQSDDFFWNRAAFVYSLDLCEKLFVKLGDSSFASQCSSVKATIKGTLDSHWNGDYMFESTIRMKDGAVVHAFSSFGVYPITSYKVAKTMEVLADAFCVEFTLNQVQTNEGISGILIGRYPGDIYAGGNPWQLLTAVYAKTFYQMANSLIMSNGFSDSLDQDAWHQLLRISSGSSLRSQAKAALHAGDAVLYRMFQNVKDDGGHISEQMDRNNGTQKSAHDLTWSYANILSAMQERSKLTQLMSQVFPGQSQ